jgi:hypothetical protein
MAAIPVQDQISELSALLKTVYGPGVEQQQNLAAMLWKRFGEAQIRMGGNAYEFPARMVNTQSVGARGYRVGLPVPILNIDTTARVRQKFFYCTFDIPGPDIEKGKGNANAFVNTLTDKMRSLTEMGLKDLNMQTYLDGTGVRATLKVNTAGFAAGGTSAGTAQVDRIKYLRVGMHVDVVSSADGVTQRITGDNDPGDSSNIRWTVSKLTPNDTVFNAAGVPTMEFSKSIPLTPTAPTGVLVGDFVVRHKAQGTELIGLDALVDDGVFNAGALILEDIDRSLNPLWKGKVFSNSGTPRDLTLNLMQLAMDVPEVISGRRIDLVVGSYNARDRYLQLLVPQKRFTDLKMDGGFQVLEYNGRDFLVDVDCQDDRVYFLNRESIKKFGLFDLQFVEQTGGILKHDSLQAGDVFYGFMRLIANLGVIQANANSKIVDLPIDVNYLLNQ